MSEDKSKSSASTASTASTQQQQPQEPKSNPELGLLEEDDEFEEFPAEGTYVIN